MHGLGLRVEAIGFRDSFKSPARVVFYGFS